jgi:cysteine-rich repeat protein
MDERGRIVVVAASLTLLGCPSIEQAVNPGGSSGEGSDSTGSSSTTGATGSTGVDGSSDDGATTAAPGPVCGNAVPEDGEECDDGNASDADACTSSCRVPTCDDGLFDGAEEGVDCGGDCPACTCEPPCKASEICAAGECVAAASCAALSSAGLTNGIYTIDPDGRGGAAPFDVECDFEAFGGGWTLVAVTSDDGTSTWTWDDRAQWTTDTTEIGTLRKTFSDFKSAALHVVPLTELYFVHQPSGITAVYDVGGGGPHDSMSAFMMTHAEPQAWAVGTGYPLTGGSLSLDAKLCETALYINASDDDQQPGAHAAGPIWRGLNNDVSCGPYFDDPGISGSWGGRASATTSESGARGYGRLLGENTGAPGTSENYLQLWVR